MFTHSSPRSFFVCLTTFLPSTSQHVFHILVVFSRDKISEVKVLILKTSMGVIHVSFGLERYSSGENAFTCLFVLYIFFIVTSMFFPPPYRVFYCSNTADFIMLLSSGAFSLSLFNHTFIDLSLNNSTLNF